jgi:hypothetical protein
MVINNDQLFPKILGSTALIIAMVAATFSIFGIGTLFSGAATSVIIMASALEMGKIVSVSFLYRYWNKTSKWLRSYLIVAVLALMAITSIGVFGWLSAAYQGSSLKYEITQQQISVLEGQKTQLDSQSDISTNRIKELSALRSSQEARMSEVLNNTVLARNPTQFRQVQEQNLQLIRDTESSVSTEQKKLESLRGQRLDIDKRIADIRMENIKTKDVVTFQFVADSIGLSLNTTVKWFIVVIIVVFDPLAVCLLLSYNVIVFDRSTKQKVVVSEIVPIESPMPIGDIKKN